MALRGLGRYPPAPRPWLIATSFPHGEEELKWSAPTGLETVAPIERGSFVTLGVDQDTGAADCLGCHVRSIHRIRKQQPTEPLFLDDPGNGKAPETGDRNRSK